MARPRQSRPTSPQAARSGRAPSGAHSESDGEAHTKPGAEVNTSNIKHVTATGDIVTVTASMRSVVLTATSDTATAVVKAGGSGGTTVLTLSVVANETLVVPLEDVSCSGGIHVTLTGTSPKCSVVFA